ncbi:MAG: 50S ribosomal protein L13 [Vampirovibrio sp.]|nr:50S ribosomal protein L13 [Vampirovibrio sp.]
MTMKTFSAKPAEITRKWWVVDAEDKTLGRLATIIANILRGKLNPQYTPHIDSGDFVVVINAEKVKVTGKKPQQKMYYRHSGYPGGFRSINFEKLQEKAPEQIIEKAVKGMLPHNSLGRQQLTKLKIYAGPSHPHAAQQPQVYQELEIVK